MTTAPSSSSPSPENDAVSAPAEETLRKIRTLSRVSAAVMAVGVLTVFSVIAFRVMSGERAPAIPDQPVAVEALIPQGARVVETLTGEGRIIVRTVSEGTSVLYVFDAATLRPIGTITLNGNP